MSTGASQSPSFLEMFTDAADPEPVPEDDGKWLRHVEIEQAKGTLMALFGIGSDDAFRVMSAQSQRRNIKVHKLAAKILDSVRTEFDNADFVLSAHESLDRLLSD